MIKSLEKDIYGLKKEIQERDETIQDKVQYIPKHCYSKQLHVVNSYTVFASRMTLGVVDT